MNNILKIKRKHTDDAAPAALSPGELAFNEVSKILYYGDEANNVRKIGGEGAYVTLDTNQTITGVKTFTGAVDLGSNARATTPISSANNTLVATTEFVKLAAENLDGGTI